MGEKITLFLKDIVRFFGYKGSGNSFIIVEDYKSSILFSVPFLIMLLICAIKTRTKIKGEGVRKGDANELYKPTQEIKSSEEKFKGVILSLFIFFILQLLLFPFPNHPRRFFYAIGIISLIPAIAFKIQNSPKSEKESARKKIILFNKKLIILTIFSSHIGGQIYLFKKAVDELEEKGRFHISTNYKYQFELAKYIRENGESSFVNISGFINFPIMFGKSSQIPDYIYLLSTYYFYARDDFVKMIKRVIQIHSGKKFILQRGEDELETLRKVGEIMEMKMEMVKKIPEDKPVYYIVEFHKVKTDNEREKE